jgi:cell division protein FtsQ
VRVRRELPHTVAIDIVERELGVAVALGAIYLVDERGQVFKRARAGEAAEVPIVTGLPRDRYLADPAQVRAVLRRAIALGRAWRQHGRNEPLGELHHDGGHDAAAAFTAYFPHAGRSVGVRIGVPDESTPDRLARLDAVMAALDRRGARAALVHLDQRTQLDRIAVRIVGEPGTISVKDASRAGDVANQAL